ncbi:hypothetical protein BSKO_10082 [Bryopsis sp. KO-2023]|nr:hypothetical protein BSKO_10082 [Bryopsis sp. KO-2023]
MQETQHGWGQALESPSYYGFAPATPPAVRFLRRGGAKQDEGEHRYKKFEDLWETKWHGACDVSLEDLDGQLLPEHSSLSRSSLMRSLGQLFGRKPTPSEPEKFQLAEGFEDWGIPPYPEDYVDPAELRADDFYS